MNFLFAELYNAGYANLRSANGRTIGTQRMNYTCGLFVGLQQAWYDGRYCYEHEADAVKACLEWDGTGDPPGPWIKYKGEIERLGPGAVGEIDGVWNVRASVPGPASESGAHREQSRPPESAPQPATQPRHPTERT